MDSVVSFGGDGTRKDINQTKFLWVKAFQARTTRESSSRQSGATSSSFAAASFDQRGPSVRLYSSSSMRAKSTFMNLVPMVKRVPGVTWTRPSGKSSVAGATQTQLPAPSRRKRVMNTFTATFPL